jgi:hypothetical protein
VCYAIRADGIIVSAVSTLVIFCSGWTLQLKLHQENLTSNYQRSAVNRGGHSNYSRTDINTLDVSSNHMIKLFRYTIVSFLSIIFFSCNKDQYYINIPSKYSGWVYVISSKDKYSGNNEFSIDSNGIVYIPHQDCKKEPLILIKVDGKEIPLTRIKITEEFEANDLYQVTFNRFYFPFKTTYDPNNIFDTAFVFEGIEISRFKHLVIQNKIDIKRLNSCN